jgi:hypothetical protein
MGSTVFTSADIKGTSADIKDASGRAATNAFDETEVAVEVAFAADAEAGAAESEASEAEAEVGLDTEAGTRRPSSAKAKINGPKNTSSMAATATLTSLPLT